MKVHELAKVTLQNDMDLILAHKRSMRLAEVAGLSLPAQTTFATAVSEVSRNTIEHGKNGCLILSVSSGQRDKYIIAKITDEEKIDQNFEGLEYARRLVSKYNVVTSANETSIELYFYIPDSSRIDNSKLDEWKIMFRNEPSISPYEEIKRKNEQLQDLAQKLRESEQQYITLTNALPLIIFSLNDKGELVYANEWLTQFTGASINNLNETKWKSVIHPEDYDSFSALLNRNHSPGAAKLQCRFRHRNDDNYYWHLTSISPLSDENGKLLYWIGFIVDINAQKVVEQTLQNNRELIEMQQKLKDNQNILEDNISELNRSNRELQEFAYIASHDLQEPTRKINFYSDYLVTKYETVLDRKGIEYLSNLQSASRRMRTLINDLLSFAKVEREGVRLADIDLNTVAKTALLDLEMIIGDKNATFVIEPLPNIMADESMMHQLFENLIGNALKYSKRDVEPEIKIWSVQKNDWIEIFIKDNGIGFDEKYLPQMFTLFKRLHSSQQYEGTGLGLAICQKIVALHNGTINAHSCEGEGSTFIVTLPVNQTIENGSE